MFYALDEAKQIVSSSEAAAKQRSGRFRCLKCQEKVRLILPQQKKPYFAHYPSISKSRTAEGIWHQEMKSRIERWGSTAGLVFQKEQYQKSLERTPDLAHFPLALEVQGSRVPPAEIFQRTCDYQAAGWQVRWLLAPQLAERSRHAFARVFFAYRRDLGIFRWLCQPEGICLEYHCFERNGKISGKRHFYPFTQTITPFLRIEGTFKKAQLYRKPYDRSRIAAKLRRREKALLFAQERCYLLGSHLLGLPDFLYYPAQQLPVLKEYSLWLRLLFWQKLQTRPHWPPQALQELLVSLIEKNPEAFYPSPLLTKEEAAAAFAAETLPYWRAAGRLRYNAEGIYDII